MENYFMVYSNNGSVPKKVIFQIKEKTLTSLTGNVDFDNKKICFLDSEGRICTGKGYFLSSLSEEKAKELIEEYKENGILSNGGYPSSKSGLERGASNY
jgi:hypothetical protein